MCILHAITGLVLRGPHTGYGWDETVYISQIDPHVPAGIFGPPRARGLTLLTAPASLVSGSILVMRLWLAIVSAICMFLAYLPWLRVRHGQVVPLAAGLFSTLWVAIFYSYTAMPNQYVGYGAVAATGWLLAALRPSGRRRDVFYSALAVAITALMRPSDALFLIVAMLPVAVLADGRSWRRRAAAAGALIAGYAAGIAEWIIEAYVSFGGPAHRFAAASQENTGGLHWTFGAQLRTLGGPTLCRGSCVPSAPLTTELWWYALVPLVILGLVAARRSGQLLMFGLATGAAVTLATQYFVFVAYSAPRFLEPTYLLLVLPVAEGLVFLASRASPAARPIVATAIAMVLAVAEVPQLHALHDTASLARSKWARDLSIAQYIHDHGVSRPCYIGGVEQAEIAFADGCHNISDLGGDVRGVLATTTAPVAIVSQLPDDRVQLLAHRNHGVAPPVYFDGYWVAIIGRHPLSNEQVVLPKRPTAGRHRHQLHT